MSSVGQINKLNYNFAQEKERFSDRLQGAPSWGFRCVCREAAPPPLQTAPPPTPTAISAISHPRTALHPGLRGGLLLGKKKDDTIGKVCVSTIRTLSYCLLSVHPPLLMSVSRSISPEAASPAPTLSVPSPSRFLSGAHQVTDGLSRIAESDDHLLLRL